MDQDAGPSSVSGDKLDVSGLIVRGRSFASDPRNDPSRPPSADKRNRTWVRDPENASPSRAASPVPLSTSGSIDPPGESGPQSDKSDFKYTDYKRTLLFSSTGIRPRPVTPLVVDYDPTRPDTPPESVTANIRAGPESTANPNKPQDKKVFGPDADTLGSDRGQENPGKSSEPGSTSTGGLPGDNKQGTAHPSDGIEPNHQTQTAESGKLGQNTVNSQPSGDPNYPGPNNENNHPGSVGHPGKNSQVIPDSGPYGNTPNNNLNNNNANKSGGGDNRVENNQVNPSTGTYGSDPKNQTIVSRNTPGQKNQSGDIPNSTGQTPGSNSVLTSDKGSSLNQSAGNPSQSVPGTNNPQGKNSGSDKPDSNKGTPGAPNVIVTGPEDSRNQAGEGARVEEKGSNQKGASPNSQVDGTASQQTADANNPSTASGSAANKQKGTYSEDDRPIRPAKQTAFFIDVNDSADQKVKQGSKSNPPKKPGPRNTGYPDARSQKSTKGDYMYTDRGQNNKTSRDKGTRQSTQGPNKGGNKTTTPVTGTKQPRVYPKHVHVDRGRDVAGTRQRESLRSRSRSPAKSPVVWSDDNSKYPTSGSDSPDRKSSRGQSRESQGAQYHRNRQDSPDRDRKGHPHAGGSQKRSSRHDKHVEFEDPDKSKKRRVSLHDSFDIATQTAIAITDVDAFLYPHKIEEAGGKILYPSQRHFSPERYPSDSILTDRPYHSKSKPYRAMASREQSSTKSPRDAWPDSKKPSTMASPRTTSRQGELTNMATDLMERIRHLEDENKTLGAENQTLREEKEDLLQKYHNAKKDCDQLRKKVYDANVEKAERVRDLESERDSIKIKLDDEAAELRMENRNLSEKIRYLETLNKREHSDRTEDKSKLEHIIQSLQDENDELRADLNKSRTETLGTLKDLDNARKEIVRVIKPSEELKKEIERLEQELKATREESLRTLRELDAVRKVHDKTEAENDRLAVQFSMLETDMDKIIRESKAAKAETAQKNTDILSLKQKLESLDAHFRNSNDLVREKDTIIESLTREIHDLKSSNGALLKDLSVAQGDKMTLQVVDSQFQDIQNAHKKLLEENKRLQAAVLRKNMDNTGKSHESEDLRKKLKESTHMLENANMRVKMLEEWMDDIYNTEDPEPAPTQIPTYRSDYSRAERVETPSPLPELVRLTEPKSSLDNMVKKYTLRNLESKRRYKKYGMINH